MACVTGAAGQVALPVMSVGIELIDQHLSGNGPALGGLHEVHGDHLDAAAGFLTVLIGPPCSAACPADCAAGHVVRARHEVTRLDHRRPNTRLGKVGNEINGFAAARTSGAFSENYIENAPLLS